MLCLAVAGCVLDDGVEEDPSGFEGCEGGKCDGLLDFEVVDIFRERPIYVCALGHYDPRCENADTVGEYLAMPGTFEAQADVTRDGSRLEIVTHEYRVLAPATDDLVIHNLRTGFINNWTSRAGFKLELGVDGADAYWKVESAPQRFWGQALAWPGNGRVFGQEWICAGLWCDSINTTARFDRIPRDAVVEYRLVLVPIWNIGRFSEGTYDIEFDLLPN